MIFAEWECDNCEGVMEFEISFDNIESEPLIEYCPYCGMKYKEWNKRGEHE